MKKYTIAVIDDDTQLCKLLTSLAVLDNFRFGIEDYELCMKAFGDMDNLDGIVRHIETARPDMILLDYFLGPLGCITALGVLERIAYCCAKTSDVYVVTGMYEEDARVQLAKEKLLPLDIGIIQKPFSIEDLLGFVRNSIGKHTVH